MAEDYAAMTVSERLFAAGLMGDYDVAVAANGVQRVDAPLAEAGLVRDEKGMHRSQNGASHIGSAG